MKLKSSAEKLEKEFCQTIVSKNYAEARNIYQRHAEKVHSLRTVWIAQYNQNMEQKRFTRAVSIATCFENTRQWIVPAATGQVEEFLAQGDYNKAKKWLQQYPVNYFSIIEALTKLRHLSHPHLLLLLEAIEENPRRDKQEVMEILNSSLEILKKSAYRDGYLLQLPDQCELMVVGDLHGNRNNLDIIMKVANLDSNPLRHIVFQEVIHSRGILIDQRDLSFLEIIDILKLMVDFPDRVHFLLGNHDLNFLFKRETLRGGKKLNALFERGLQLILGDEEEVAAKYREIISWMPAAIQCGSLLLTHSNPTHEELGDFDFQYLRQMQPLEAKGMIDRMVSGRDHNEETIALFLEKTNSRLSLIGHEICRGGYHISTPQQLILDSCHNRGYYLLCRPFLVDSMKDLKRGLRPIRPE